MLQQDLTESRDGCCCDPLLHRSLHNDAASQNSATIEEAIVFWRATQLQNSRQATNRHVKSSPLRDVSRKHVCMRLFLHGMEFVSSRSTKAFVSELKRDHTSRT